MPWLMALGPSLTTWGQRGGGQRGVAFAAWGHHVRGAGSGGPPGLGMGGPEGVGMWGPSGMGTWGPPGFMGTPMGSGTLRDGDMKGWGHGDPQGSWGRLWDQGPSGMGTWGPLGLGTWGPSGFMGTPVGSGTLGDGDMKGWGHGDP